MNNVNMANMNAMGGPVGGAPMAMAMNNGAIPVQPRPDALTNRTVLNTYIYEYFLKEGMYECARGMLTSDQPLNVTKQSPGRHDENGNAMGNGVGADPMDTDRKDEMGMKKPSDLPDPNLPDSASENGFLYEWFCLFWDMMRAHQRTGVGNPQVNQYMNHTQQSRLKQNQQQEMLRQMRPDGPMNQFNPMMRNMPNGMQMKQNTLARTAMANNQNNPQAMQMMQQANKHNQMQRDPSDMDGNRRPASPGGTENAPSPSKRPRLDGVAPFNPQQAGMMPNGRPQPQGMPGQQVGNSPSTSAAAQATQMLIANNVDPTRLTTLQFQQFVNQPQAQQQKSIATYAQNQQHHHLQQMPNKGMQNPGPHGQGSPMMAQGPGTELNFAYNTNEMNPNGMRPQPGNNGGSNHALQDYQMQLMLLEQQNKKRLMMARQEQDGMGGIRGDGAPGGPGGPGGHPGPNGQPFPDTSPQGARNGASPNPSEQMKRGTPQMNPAGIPSPLPEGGPSRGSPNPMNFMPQNMDPSIAPQQFFKGMNGMDGNMAAVQMQNGMRPPSSHPGQPFNGPMNPQMMAAARQQQAQAQAGPQMQWQGGPNQAGNPMVQQGPPGQVQGTPQQRSMPPPSAPAPGANNAPGRTQPSSPAVSNAAPPTPQQSNKAAPKKKESKAKAKAAAAKKPNAANAAAPPAAPAEQPAAQETAEAAAPQTPITPNPANFAKNNQITVPNPQTSAAAAVAPAAAPQAAPQPPHDANQNGFGMDNNMNFDVGNLDFANPLQTGDVLDGFDFDSFLHDNDGGDTTFDFNPNFGMEGTGEIGAD